MRTAKRSFASFGIAASRRMLRAAFHSRLQKVGSLAFQQHVGHSCLVICTFQSHSTSLIHQDLYIPEHVATIGKQSLLFQATLRLFDRPQQRNFESMPTLLSHCLHRLPCVVGCQAPSGRPSYLWACKWLVV